MSCGFKLLLTSPAQFIELPLERLRDEEILHVRRGSSHGRIHRVEMGYQYGRLMSPVRACLHHTIRRRLAFLLHKSNTSSHYPSLQHSHTPRFHTREHLEVADRLDAYHSTPNSHCENYLRG